MENRSRDKQGAQPGKPNRSLELNSVTNAIFNFQSQVGAIPLFSCK